MVNSDDLISTYAEYTDADGNVQRQYLRGKRGPWNLKEALAEYIHSLWSNWMRYLLSQSQENEDGSVTIPADWVAKLKQHMITEPVNLTETQKQHNRKGSEEIIRIFVQNLDEGD